MKITKRQNKKSKTIDKLIEDGFVLLYLSGNHYIYAKNYKRIAYNPEKDIIEFGYQINDKDRIE